MSHCNTKENPAKHNAKKHLLKAAYHKDIYETAD